MRSVEITGSFVAVKHQRFRLEVHRDATTCGKVVSTTRVPADISVGIVTLSTLALHADCKVRKLVRNHPFGRRRDGCCRLRKRSEITNFCSVC